MPRATANEDELEVCIPAGEFIRGRMPIEGTPDHDTDPVQSVYISAFYVDKYTVTNRRYRACIDAGACSLPEDETGTYDFQNTAGDDHFTWGISWDQAVTFCNWDGGRRLITEAEWEKAGRGAAPSEAEYPWPGSDFRCDLYFISECGWMWDISMPRSDPYDAFPGTVSPYGVEGMLGGGYQWVQDWYDEDYYADPTSLVDPQGPPTGLVRTKRGNGRWGGTSGDRWTSRRPDAALTSIRCGRDGEAK